MAVDKYLEKYFYTYVLPAYDQNVFNAFNPDTYTLKGYRSGNFANGDWGAPMDDFGNNLDNDIYYDKKIYNQIKSGNIDEETKNKFIQIHSRTEDSFNGPESGYGLWVWEFSNAAINKETGLDILSNPYNKAVSSWVQEDYAAEQKRIQEEAAKTKQETERLTAETNERQRYFNRSRSVNAAIDVKKKQTEDLAATEAAQNAAQKKNQLLARSPIPIQLLTKDKKNTSLLGG